MIVAGTLLIAFNGTTDTGQFLGDQVCSIKAAYLFVQNTNPDRVLLAASPSNELHFLWQKFIDTYNVQVIYDTFHPGNNEQRFEAWTKWRIERAIEGIKFDHYRELYRRCAPDGLQRQTLLCGGENGLHRKNIFEYFYYGQENFTFGCPDEKIINGDHFGDELIYHPTYPPDRGVFLAPYAKCQGNWVFTFDYWAKVVHKLIDAGITVTVNYNGNFCGELDGHPLYRKIFPGYKELVDEMCRHKIVTCGNTGIGWFAFMCGLPVIAMEPPNSNMADYRYALCGCKSLVEIIDTPDADYCAKRLIEEVNRVVVFTTGCYDVIHAGHIRHLEESKSLGTKLIVALNSDSSVKRLKGENRPINNQEQRMAVLQAIRYIDDVRLFDGDNALDLIRELKPDIITNGCDHKLEEIVGKDFVEQYGGRAIVTGGKREQSSTKIISQVIRMSDIMKAIQDGSSVSLNPWEKLKLTADQFMSVSKLPGDVVDFGAYRGGVSLILRRLAPNKDLHLFDTWDGNPFDDSLCHHKVGKWKTGLAECKAFVGENERTHYHAGIFPDTGKELNGRKFCFVYVDPDTYQAVKEAIAFFWPRLVQGGKLFFDDYGHEPCAGVKKAVDEAFTMNQITIYPQNETAVVVKK